MGEEQEDLLFQGHPVLAIQRRQQEDRLGISQGYQKRLEINSRSH